MRKYSIKVTTKIKLYRAVRAPKRKETNIIGVEETETLPSKRKRRKMGKKRGKQP